MADTAQVRLVTFRSHSQSSSSLGREKSSLGTTESFAPVFSMVYRSFTDTSKSKGAWLARMSVWSMPKQSTKVSMKSITDRWLTTTPLGWPVEPEVKLVYSGSVSTT